MTYRKKIDWLYCYRDSLERQRTLRQEVEQLRAMAEGVSRPLSAVTAPDHADRLARAVERIAAKQAELEEQVLLSLRLRDEVEALIAQVQDQRLQELLRRRYILGERFDKIAEEMHLDTRWVYRLHRRAVQKLNIPQKI